MVASHWILRRREPNQPAVVLEVNTDITARRLAEDALREADRNKDRFMAMLAHELRNPLGAMLSSVALLDRAGGADAAASIARGVIERQLAHLVRLVDDLLDVERLTHGRIELKKTRVELSAVVDEAIETCRPLIDAGSHQLKISLPEEAIFLDADIVRLAQVLSNLLDNAIKYTPAGGTIELLAERAGSEAVLRVRDPGIGISADMLPKIFDIYFQAGLSPGAELKGLGLGLALVRQLTEMHGGTVAAISEGPGKGAEFVVRLPLAAGPEHDKDRSPASTETAATPQSEKRHRKVLLVDDNRDNADALACLLETEGHDVRAAYDGPGALETASQFKPEVAILDIGLPGMDGYELASRLHQSQPELVLIALSGWRIEPRDSRAREAGFRYYFTKPLDPKELSKLLAER